MSYIYKGHELPEYKDKNYHVYLDPFFKWVIDESEIAPGIDPIGLYNPVYVEDIGYIVYVGKQTTDLKWLIKKVVDNADNSYTTTWATIVNNPSHATLISAMNSKDSLVYNIDYNDLV